MPGRPIPLATGEIYHVFNRGLDHRQTFLRKRDYKRASEALAYYRFVNPPLRLAYFYTLSYDRKELFLENLHQHKTHADVLAYCLMPNHFHLILRQREDRGISKFLSNYQNSYTRYFNTKNQRIGSLFLDQFKAVRIETDVQILYVSRYIHLNPFKSFVVKSLSELYLYPWSSLPEYMKKKSGLCDTTTILTYFKTRQQYVEFVTDQADYQRNLNNIKHLSLD